MGASIMATPDIDFFANYLNPVFVETGSNMGQGIMMALKAGFKEIYSIELSKLLYDACVERFKNNSNVHLIHGDSGEKLTEVISEIDVPITFWIDAHYSGGITEGENYLPLFDELLAIKNHPIKNHTILIDDTKDWDMNLVKKMVLDINAEYEISMVDGYAYEKDIMVARINRCV
jgi:hypothetical protein